MRESADYFDEFIDAFPGSALLASASFHAGEARFQLGSFPDAVTHLTRVVDGFESDPVYPPALLRLGEAQAQLQHWAKSELAFSDFLSRFADSPHWFQARFGLGWSRENQKRYEEAIAAYRLVTERHQGPTAARAQFQIGECLFAEEQYDDAVRELLKVDILYAYPEWSAAALYEAGRAFEKLNKTAEARTQFKEVAERHKESHWAQLASQKLNELSSAGLPGR
jgi:TolA-binding protein